MKAPARAYPILRNETPQFENLIQKSERPQSGGTQIHDVSETAVDREWNERISAMRQPYLVTNFAGKWQAHGREGRRASE